MRILVTDGMDASAVEKLRGDGYEVVEQFYEPEALGGALREFDAVVIRSATKIKEPQIDAAKGGRLKLIIRRGCGQHCGAICGGGGHHGEEYAPGLLQRSGGAGHGAAVLLRAEYLHCRTHHAGGQMGEEGLFQGI